MKIGLVGLGPMGLAMGKRLLQALAGQGHSLVVYNRSAEKAAPLVEAGATLASTPAEAAAGDIVLSVVADDDAVNTVTFSEGGILSGLPGHTIHAGMSTITVEMAERLAAAHAAAGKRYLSAPVMGRPQAVEAGQIAIAAAGAPADVAAARPVFEVLAKQTFVLGEQPAQANLVKLGINHLIHSMVEGIGEYFALTEKAGVADTIAREVLVGAFNAPIYQRFSTLLLERKFRPAAASAKLALKDNRAIVAAAERYAAPLPLASVVHDRLVALIAQAGPDIDYAAISQLARRDAGLPTSIA